MIKIDSKAFRIFLHIIFWLTYLLVFTTLEKLNIQNVDFLPLLYRAAVYSLPIDFIATYFTLYFLMPKFLFKGNYTKFILYSILTAIPLILILQTIRYYFFIPTYHPDLAFKKSFWEFPYFNFTIATYFIVILAAAIKMTKRWIKIKDKQQELEKQNLTSELAMLKMQVSPHFLFNTLNNIDTLIHTDTEKASETISKLSDIMRYMLYDSQNGKVLLSKEIEYIHNLVGLQSIRLSKKNFINFQLIGDPKNKSISPLLFVPFIENALKHCDRTVDSPGISIKLLIENHKLNFKINNRFKLSQENDDIGGIGLSNVKRRLELLYPEKHILNITKLNNNFNVNLIIDLKNDNLKTSYKKGEI